MQWFVLFASEHIRLGQVVADGLDLLELLHACTVCSVLRSEVELLGRCELWEFRLTLLSGWLLNDLSVGILNDGWLPSGHASHQIVGSVGRVRAARCSHRVRSVVDGQGNL